FSSRRRHTRSDRDWSSDVCSSDLRWLNAAGEQARQTVRGQLADVPIAGHLATDGLWARLRGGVTRVVPLLIDSGSRVVWPPVVEIGRASCRERGWVGGGGAAVEET